MLFHTHIFLGIVFFFLFKDYFSGRNELIFFALILLGSVLPDIDSKNSKINQWSGFIGKIIAIFAKHRGMFHSLFFYLFLFFAISYFTRQYYAFGLFLGYLAHLISDGMTLAGVQVFYPFSKFKLKGPIKVGSFTEGIIMLCLVVLILKFLF